MEDNEDVEIFDKIELVGKITLDTPTIIIEEIANWMGLRFDNNLLSQPIYRARVLISIEQTYTDKNFIKQFVAKDNLAKLARFLNHDDTLLWTKTKLIQSWMFIKKFLADAIRTDAFGFPTPATPCRISPIFLFNRIKQHEKIEFYHNMTLEHLIKIYNCLEINEEQLRLQLIFSLNQINDKSELIKYITRLTTSSGQICSSSNVLTIDTIEPNIVNMLVPTSSEDAIKLSLKYYNRDISHSVNPLEEFIHHRCGLEPFDSHMRKVEFFNKLAYDIRYTFNPNIPEEYYERGRLFAIGGLFGLESNDNIFQELVCVSMMDNFYLGIQHGVQIFRSGIYFDDLNQMKEIPPLVCYGSTATSYKIYFFTELIDLFKNNLKFSNPAGGIFSDPAINRLKRLVETFNPRNRRQRISKRGPGSPRMIIINPNDKLWDDLLEAMDSVVLFQEKIQEQCVALFHFYKDGTEQVKNEIKSTLDAIMLLAMYMRGWKNDGQPWPIDVVPTSNNYVTFSYVLPYVDTVKDMFQTVGGNYVKDLPLMNYEGGKYCISNDTEKGITLGDRITIIDDGELTPNINSCIRTSSNWFIYTAHRYLTVIGFKPYFTPDVVKFIG